MASTAYEDMTSHAQREAARWTARLEELTDMIAPRFARQEARVHANAYLRGLLSPVQRKNGWQLAEAVGDPTPTAIQHLLGRAVWDADAVRDDLREYVVEHLGRRDAVLVVDETGFLKKGEHSVGVQRQYTGTAGRIENAQVGVFLAYATDEDRAFIDRELYLPDSWMCDRARCDKVGVPAERDFATKPELARRMIERALEADVPFLWVTGDEVYGNDRNLRIWLEQNERPYVMAISSNQYLRRENVCSQHAATIAKEIQPSQWRRLSAGDGTKGPRLYDWVWMPMLSWGRRMQRGMLVRRSVSDDTDVEYYAVYAPYQTPLEVLARVAGRRWAIEEGFETAKQLVGLDQYEVHSWAGWYRHITLALLAHACLSVMRAYAIELDMEKGGPNRRDTLRCRPSRPAGTAATDGSGSTAAAARSGLAAMACAGALAGMVVLAATSPSLRQRMPSPPHTLAATTTVGLNTSGLAGPLKKSLQRASTSKPTGFDWRRRQWAGTSQGVTANHCLVQSFLHGKICRDALVHGQLEHHATAAAARGLKHGHDGIAQQHLRPFGHTDTDAFHFRVRRPTEPSFGRTST